MSPGRTLLVAAVAASVVDCSSCGGAPQQVPVEVDPTEPTSPEVSAVPEDVEAAPVSEESESSRSPVETGPPGLRWSDGGAWIRQLGRPERWDRSFAGALGPDGGIYVGAPVPRSPDDIGPPCFVARFEPDASQAWLQCAQSEDIETFAIAAGQDETVIVTGRLKGDGVTLDQTSLANRASSSAFVAAFKATGRLRWAHSLGASGDTDAWSQGAAVTRTGQIVVGGWYTGAPSLDGADAPVLPKVTEFDGFVLAFGPMGELAWADHVGGRGQDQVTALAPAADGGVLATGWYRGTGRFGGKRLRGAPPGKGQSVFLVSYGEDGALRWARELIRSTRESESTAMAVAPDGAVYVVGSVAGRATFPGSSQRRLRTVGRHDVFVIKTSSTGETEWVRVFGGTEYDRAYGVAVSPRGASVTGTFHGPITLQPGDRSLEVETRGDGDVFVVSFSEQGELLHAESMGGEYHDQGTAIDVDADGTLTLFGWFEGRASFPLEPGVNVELEESSGYPPSTNYADTFVLRRPAW